MSAVRNNNNVKWKGKEEEKEGKKYKSMIRTGVVHVFLGRSKKREQGRCASASLNMVYLYGNHTANSESESAGYQCSLAHKPKMHTAFHILGLGAVFLNIGEVKNTSHNILCLVLYHSKVCTSPF